MRVNWHIPGRCRASHKEHHIHVKIKTNTAANTNIHRYTRACGCVYICVHVFFRYMYAPPPPPPAMPWCNAGAVAVQATLRFTTSEVILQEVPPEQMVPNEWVGTPNEEGRAVFWLGCKPNGHSRVLARGRRYSWLKALLGAPYAPLLVRHTGLDIEARLHLFREMV